MLRTGRSVKISSLLCSKERTAAYLYYTCICSWVSFKLLFTDTALGAFMRQILKGDRIKDILSNKTQNDAA